MERRLSQLFAADIAIASRGTALVGLIGAGIQNSRTPAMFECEAACLGIPLIYRLIDLNTLSYPPSDLGDLIQWAERSGFSGLNITHPCKQTAMGYVDSCSEDAAAIGAINTIVFSERQRVGHNTDCSGFGASFREDMAGLARGRVLLLGAGGAGSAVGHALLRAGVERLAIFDTDPARSDRLAQQLERRFGPGRSSATADVSTVLPTSDGLVNATPVGTSEYPGIPLDPDCLRAGSWVVDIIYFKSETELLSRARQIGCQTRSGKGMAVYQAAHAFEVITGKEPDVVRMRTHFEKAGRAFDQ